MLQGVIQRLWLGACEKERDLYQKLTGQARMICERLRKLLIFMGFHPKIIRSNRVQRKKPPQHYRLFGGPVCGCP